MKRRRGDRYSNVQVGVATLIAVALLTYLGFSKGHIPFVEHHYEVDATFATAASQLSPGSPVRIAGVNVGKVVKLRRGPGGTAIATLRVDDRGRPLHTDATMKIRPRLFLEGNFFVDVRPGTPEAPELKDGGTIPLAQTAIPVQFDQLLDTLQNDTRQDLKHTIKGLATALDDGGAQALNRGFRAWEPAFKGVAIAAEAARGPQPGDLARFVEGTSRVSTAIASRENDLRALLGSFARTTSTLAERRGDLADTLLQLDRTLGTARPALAAVDSALPGLRTFAAALRPGLRAAPAAITDLRPFVRLAGQLVQPGSLPALTARLQPALRDVAAVQPGLTTLFAKTTPIAQCITRNVIPTITAKLDDGALSTGQPAYRELLHLAPGLAAASGNFDGNGHVIRYNVGVGEASLASGLSTSLGDLVSLGSNKIVGARPRYTPGTEPPFRPDADCLDQALPNLTADAKPATARVTRTVSAATSARAIAGAVRTARKGGVITRARKALRTQEAGK